MATKKAQLEMARAPVLATHAAAAHFAAAGERQVARLLRASEALARQALALLGVSQAAPKEQTSETLAPPSQPKRRRRKKRVTTKEDLGSSGAGHGGNGRAQQAISSSATPPALDLEPMRVDAEVAPLELREADAFDPAVNLAAAAAGSAGVVPALAAAEPALAAPAATASERSDQDMEGSGSLFVDGRVIGMAAGQRLQAGSASASAPGDPGTPDDPSICLFCGAPWAECGPKPQVGPGTVNHCKKGMGDPALFAAAK